MVEEVPEIDFYSALKELKGKGYVKSRRKGDTGIGKTLETELGIKENNLKINDLRHGELIVELKGQRTKTTSNITLFTLEPNKNGTTDKGLIEKYGYLDVKGRRGLKITMKTGVYNPQGFTLVVDKKSKRIILRHRKDGDVCFWDVKSIRDKLKKKLANNLLIVFADSKKVKEKEHFHFNRAYLLSNLSAMKFLKQVEAGKIVAEFRMHIKENGSARNHGTGFRMNERYIADLYEKKDTVL